MPARTALFSIALAILCTLAPGRLAAGDKLPNLPILDERPKITLIKSLPQSYRAAHVCFGILVENSDGKMLKVNPAPDVSTSLTLGDTVSGVVPAGDKADFGAVKKVALIQGKNGPEFILQLESGLKISLLNRVLEEKEKGVIIPVLYAVFQPVEGGKSIWILKHPTAKAMRRPGAETAAATPAAPAPTDK